MKIEKIQCPACHAGINIDLKGKKMIFCPYCGSQLSVDDGDRTFTTNKNININKTVNIHKRYTDDAAIEEARIREREHSKELDAAADRRDGYIAMVVFLFSMAFFAFVVWSTYNSKKQDYISSGYIQIGKSASSFEGEQYSSVVDQLTAKGFTDIKTIDLDDAGWIKNRADTIESISVGGSTSFSSSDYFAPDAKIVISYH